MHNSFSAVVWLTAIAVVIGATAYFLFQLTQRAAGVVAFPVIDPALAWGWLSACLAVGIFTMAAVQSYRLLIPVRGAFHRRALVRWLREGHGPARSTVDWNALGMRVKPVALEERAQIALYEFERPAIGKSERENSVLFYDLPLEQLCGQLSAAADIALEHPRRSPHLAIELVGAEGEDDLYRLLTELPDTDGGVQSAAPSTVNPRTPSASPAPTPEDGRSQPPSGEMRAEAQPRPRKARLSTPSLAATEARAALARIVQRRIDAFQITTGTQWRRTIRAVVLMVSMAFAAVLSFSSYRAQTGSASLPSFVLYGALTGFLGAFVAMFLRDLTAIVEHVRRRS